MDFSTNSSGVGTNIYSVPSTTTHQLQTNQQSSPMFSSFDYHPSTTALPVPLSVPTNPLGQHPSFMQDIAFANRSARLNPSSPIVNNSNQQVKVMTRSYLPNGINEGCGMKSADEGGGGGDRMTTPTSQLGAAFGKILNGSPSAAKREKCSDETTNNPILHMNFQELTAMRAESMNFAVRAQNSQLESATSCRKRRSMSQDPYSSDFYRSERSISRGEELMDTGQPLPPPPPDFCFTQEPLSQRPMSISGGPVSSNSTSSSPKIERSPIKCPHIDPSVMRRSPRFTQAQIHQQQQQHYVSSQKYFYDPTGNQNQMGANTSSRAPNAAWGQMTRQQQLAIVNNPRWRLPHNMPPQPPQQTSPLSSQEQSLSTVPVRKASLCDPRRPSTHRGLGMNAAEQSLDQSEALMKLSPSNSSFETMMETMQNEFDFSMSGRITDTSSANRPHQDTLPQDAFGSETNDEEMTSGNGDHDSDSSQGSFPGEGLPPEQFKFFDEPFSNTWKSVQLSLVQQPELQHRARYLTEGSRGPIKNRSYDGYPTILMQGWSGSAMLHVFVASESDDPNLHLFYQVCLVSTKSNRGCCEIVFGFTTVVQMPFTPNTNNRVMSVDSVGLVKLRNSDVERRCAAVVEESKRKRDRKQEEKISCRSRMSSSPTQGTPVSSTSASICEEVGRRSLKPKSSSTRLVYRVLLLSPENTVEGVVQVVSDPIRCTQIVGGPEITRMSIKKGDAHSRPELFIIGKNFVRGTRVIFRQMANDSSDDVRWEMDAEIEAPYFTQTHLVCRVPEYTGPSLPLTAPLRVNVCIQTPTRVGRPEQFTYLPTLSIQGPPIIKKISQREVSLQGMVDMFVLGSNFSSNCRVFIRQVTEVGGVFGAPATYAETPSVIWQREAQVKTDELTQDYLVCRVPPYDGQSLEARTPSLPVQIIVEGPGGTSAPETFYYVQCQLTA
ncbi:unnamed protein product [Rodentolepis nana]|uniref:RHD domain-containing protein n=1 Tax=Rodentolepis nana TaxID=102285 RepID=A0A158QHS9_RODNA|nr:unnamed protein product [Rodentolepis nana]